MEFEEKLIYGALHYRTNKNDYWHIASGNLANIVNSLYKLSDDDRMQIFNLFCKHCGSTDSNCQCWNDE